MKMQQQIQTTSDGLPVITSRSTCQTEGNTAFDPLKNCNMFHNLLKQYKTKKNSKVKVSQEELQFQEGGKDELNNDKEFLNAENEKYLKKIYECRYGDKYEKMTRDYKRYLSADLQQMRYLNMRTEEEKLLDNMKIQNKGFEKFGDTIYTGDTTMKNFYIKYQKFKILDRKQPISKFTPSFAFIKKSNEERIIPNPLGLVQRKGEDYILRMNNQKVGDSYLRALSSSLKYSNHLNSLQLKGNRMSNDGANNLFNCINYNKNLIYKIHTLNLSNNQIGKKSINEIVKYIQDEKCNLENFNLFQNELYDENIKIIAENLSIYSKYKMVSINLGNNFVTDESIPSLCQMINQCTGLRVLALNKNEITNEGATQLIIEIKKHTELRVLDLAWNKIGKDLIKEPIYEEIVNTDLRQPDRNMHNFELYEAQKFLRFNFRRNPLLPPLDAKGGDKKKDDKKDQKEVYKIPSKVNVPTIPISPFATELGSFFHETNTNLIHLDISHNNLNYSDANFLCNEIKENHSILGFHVDGNAMEIDGLGFISPLDSNNKKHNYFSNSQIFYDLDKDYRLLKSNIDAVRKIRGKNNCWICEGWKEIKFHYKPKEEVLDVSNHLMKIHLNFDNYKPFDMIYLNSEYEVVRMCPPGEINYFFTFDSEPCTENDVSNTNTISSLKHSDYIKFEFDNDFLEEYNNLIAKLSYEKFAEDNPDLKQAQNSGGASLNTVINYTAPENKQSIIITVKQICKKNVKVNNQVIDDEYRNMLKFSVPRPVKIINKFVKPRTPWTFPMSIWAYYDYDYEGESEEYLNKCFEFDFNRCQFLKDFKKTDNNLEEKLEELRQILRPRYRDLIDCYKYYSSQSNCQIWQITQNYLVEFIGKCPNLCNKEYDINNIFLCQTGVVSNQIDKEEKTKNKLKTLSENIVRHQFMNLLVKSAKDKYISQLKTMDDLIECVKYTFENHYDVAIKGFEYHTWRKERYYNEQVDNFLKAYLPILDALYHSWAAQKGPTKKDVWMTLAEFDSLVQSFVDINEYPIKNNPLLFNYSMRLQINEISTERHVCMMFPEFLEALCRAVDKASPAPEGEPIEEWPKEKRIAQPLVTKLENVIFKLIKLITHPDYKNLKEKFPMPIKDLSTGLFTIDYEGNPYYQGFIIKAKGS